MRTRLIGLILVALAAAAMPAGANGPADDELLFRYTPGYDNTKQEVSIDRAGWPEPKADAKAVAETGGSLVLDASVGGVVVGSTGSPSAVATATVLAPRFTWSDNLLRLTVQFSYKLEVETTDDVNVTVGPAMDEALRASVSAEWDGEVPSRYTQGWGLTENDDQQVSVSSNGTWISTGQAESTSYLRAPCEGADVAPATSSRLELRLPSAWMGARSSLRSARLSVWVSEMAVYRDPTMPCEHVQEIDVLDNDFAPRDVGVKQYQAVKFDFSGAQNYHDVIVPFHGSAYPNDPIDTFWPGVWTYYCAVHGTPDGEGMAGTITVT